MTANARIARRHCPALETRPAAAFRYRRRWSNSLGPASPRQSSPPRTCPRRGMTFGRRGLPRRRTSVTRVALTRDVRPVQEALELCLHPRPLGLNDGEEDAVAEPTIPHDHMRPQDPLADRAQFGDRGL